MQTRVWVLVVISCCAALVAFALMYVSFTQAREMFAVLHPFCITPAGHLFYLRQTIEVMQITWLLSGVAGLLSWSCAFAAHRSTSAASRGARRTATALLVLSSFALVALALSFGWYRLAYYLCSLT